ncbi:MAG: cell division ATP-binding protein FtsE, partial [Candidatus Tectomicrobia bacterium]|nr:cell division ATP-binding protein FtsE [Candidatus Tectomicrobia bacterium]
MIQMFHVYKSYSREVRALVDVSLRIDEGEFVFIMGPSGAGKTTVMRLIFCAEQTSVGQIIVNGKNLSKMKKEDIPYFRRTIGMVFQDFKLLEKRSVYENVAFAQRVLGSPEKMIRQRVSQVLQLVGLEQKRDTSVIRLSGGEQQRVAIARAIVNEPAILLADEPTGNLDERLAFEIMKIFEEIQAKGTTVVV